MKNQKQKLTLAGLVAVTCFIATATIAKLKGADPVFTVQNKIPPTFTVTNKIAPSGDPYGVLSYDLFLGKIRTGQHGMLVVGVEDQYVNGYVLHCRVVSGFGGLQDGEYNCWLDSTTNRPMLQLKKAAVGVPKKGPFPKSSTTLPIGAPTVGINPHPEQEHGSFVGTMVMGHTTTLAPSVGLLGSTNCTSYG
jgi:hypothetical protein